MATMPTDLHFDLKIRSSITPLEVSKKIGQVIDGAARYVNDYVFKNIRTEIKNIVHVSTKDVRSIHGVQSRKLFGAANNPIREKINQYASAYGFWVNYKKMPYFKTLVNDDETFVIHAKNHKYLTVPITGSTAHYHSNKSLKNKTLQDYAFQTVGFNPHFKMWYVGKNWYQAAVKHNKEVIFVGKESVTMRPNYRLSTMRDIATNQTRDIVEELSRRGIAQFLQTR